MTAAATTAPPAAAHPATAPPARSADRVAGYDVARALAILGMILVHFRLVAAAEGAAGPAWLAAALNLLDGRAAATFVVLAGVGVTLMSRRAVSSDDPALLAAGRRTLRRRGVFLLALGLLNLAIWPGDILRVYGVSLLLAAHLLRAPGRLLLALAAALVVAFTLLVVFGDFERNWDWRTMTYRHLWTPAGLLRNLFYDGFRSVLPWTGLLLYGMWLGRLDVARPRTGLRVLSIAAAVAVAAELASRAIESRLRAHPVAGLDPETAHALFGTESMPALPLFLLAAGGAATAVIALCALLVPRPTGAWRPLAATGRLALTWYAAHILIGLGLLVATGHVSTDPLPVAAGYGLAFFAVAVALSWAWSFVADRGPLEWLMRKVCG